ncbi:MAG: hypothetical protein LBN04_12370 [Oscillospiraceae bacterium]|jgi:hypothetical protein|nr:hypothetical protein [Oscillospiraceae bacterium]
MEKKLYRWFMAFLLVIALLGLLAMISGAARHAQRPRLPEQMHKQEIFI